MEHFLFQFLQYSFSCEAWVAYVFTCLWFWVQVDAEQLQSLFDSHEAGFDFPLALQPQNLVQNFLSDEEDIDFADSLLNDYPPTPRSSSNAYVLDTSDRETYLAYGEVIENL